MSPIVLRPQWGPHPWGLGCCVEWQVVQEDQETPPNQTEARRFEEIEAMVERWVEYFTSEPDPDPLIEEIDLDEPLYYDSELSEDSSDDDTIYLIQ